MPARVDPQRRGGDRSWLRIEADADRIPALYEEGPGCSSLSLGSVQITDQVKFRVSEDALG